MAKRRGRSNGAQWTQDYNERIRVATPRWTTEDHTIKINEAYKSRGDGDSVDHVIPLKGKRVSGLHTPDNLKVIPWTENHKKKNRWNPMNEIIMHKNDDGTYWQEVVVV